MPNSSEIFVFTQLYKWLWSARVEFNELFFSEGTEARAHFDYCQRPLEADSTAHCKMVKEWNTHPYSFDIPKTSNFMAKMNTKLYKSTTN